MYENQKNSRKNLSRKQIEQTKVELKLRRPKELWDTRIKHSLFLNFAFDCESRKSATSTFTTPPFESNVLQNHKKLLTALNEQCLSIHFRKSL